MLRKVLDVSNELVNADAPPEAGRPQAEFSSNRYWNHKLRCISFIATVTRATTSMLFDPRSSLNLTLAAMSYTDKATYTSNHLGVLIAVLLKLLCDLPISIGVREYFSGSDVSTDADFCQQFVYPLRLFNRELPPTLLPISEGCVRCVYPLQVLLQLCNVYTHSRHIGKRVKFPIQLDFGYAKLELSSLEVRGLYM